MYETILVFLSFYIGYANVIDQRCIFFYRNQIFCKPCYQTLLNKEFNVGPLEWKYTHICKL